VRIQKRISIKLRKPTLNDSPKLYELINRCKPLDLNSRYAYMLICTHFKETSVVIEYEGRLVGALTGYRKPEDPHIFFVWQVAVDVSMRSQGLAERMVLWLLKEPSLTDIHYIETTISPSNKASQRVFEKVAAHLGAGLSQEPYFDQKLFGGDAHEDEYLFSIGAFTLKKGAM
jgi:L-2,4-diaminobutyric acid acetyltransferase